MKNISRYIAITIVLAISLSACGKKEESKPAEAAPQEIVAEAEEAPEEKTYHTDEFWGCKYSVPDSWAVTKNESQVTYQLGDNGLLLMMFYHQEISDDQWDEGATALIKSLESETITIKEFAPLESARYPTYSMKGDCINNGQTYQYDGYVVNVDNTAIVLIQRAVLDDSQGSEEDLNTILNTFDSTGLSEYLGLSSKATDENSDAKEFEVTIDVTGRWEDSKVVFEIDTNLPDEAELMFSLRKGDYNTDDNFTAQDKGTVAGGHVTTSGFSASGDPLSGDYDLCVSMSLPRLQSDNVRLKIGEKGEYMTGPLVEASSISDANTVSALFSVSVDDEIEVVPESDYSFTIFRTEEEDEEEQEEEEESTGESAEANKEFIEKYESEIVVAAKMSLDNYLTGYKMSLAPQNWTMAKFDETDTVAASTEITYNGVKATYFYVGTLNINDAGIVESATPHYLAVGDVVLGDDGYCDDVFESIGALSGN